MNSENITNHYFVDEAGDLTLFNKSGKIIVGQPGVSKYFMVGVAHISEPQKIETTLHQLRDSLLKDPYFKGVPSMRPESNKTYYSFHGSKDLPEVRREVFRLLAEFDIKIQVIIRRKDALAAEANRLFKNSGIKTSGNDVYDDLIKRLFRNLLHKAEANEIVIARRGKSDRLAAIETALNRAKQNFEKKYNIETNSQTNIYPAYPHERAGLQVIDYYLWALQRLYEKQEERFFGLLESQFSLIIDLDDKRSYKYGEYYSKTNPLSAQKIKP